METKGKKIKTVDITPTWQAALSISLMAIENGTPSGVKAAKDTLIQMANIAERYKEIFYKKSIISIEGRLYSIEQNLAKRIRNYSINGNGEKRDELLKKVQKEYQEIVKIDSYYF